MTAGTGNVTVCRSCTAKYAQRLFLGTWWRTKDGTTCAVCGEPFSGVGRWISPEKWLQLEAIDALRAGFLARDPEASRLWVSRFGKEKGTASPEEKLRERRVVDEMRSKKKYNLP